MRMIRVDDEVYEALRNRGKTGDSFNFVLRQLLNLKDKISTKNEPQKLMPEDEKLIGFFEILNRHLPEVWDTSPKRRDHITEVVINFLKQPKSLSTAERQKRATQETARKYGVDYTTIHDKCGRQLYGSDPYLIEKFREALEAIERDWENLKKNSLFQ